MRFYGTTTLRTALAVATAIAATAAAAIAPAHAGAASCPPPPPNVHPFAPWGDANDYVLTSGGSFESSGTPWSLSGGAAVVADNDALGLAGSGSHALSLPSGASATSFCTTAPQIAGVVRFTARNVGDAPGALHVELIVNGGKNGVYDGGIVSIASTSWDVSPIVAIPWKQMKGAVQLQVRLTSIGAGAVVVDDVYLDPYQAT